MDYPNDYPNNYPNIKGVVVAYEVQTVDYFTAIVIGFVYAFFLALLFDRILGYDRIDRLCNINNMYPLNKSDEGKRMNLTACKKAQYDYDVQKAGYMIIIGILSMLLGGYLIKQDPKYATGGMGIGVGGIFLIIYYICANWTKMSSNLQILILALTFLLLFFGSTQYYYY